MTLVHRSDRFRAHGARWTSSTAGVEAGRAAIYTFHELADIDLRADGERSSHVVLKDIKAKTTREVEVDVVLPMLGFVSDMGRSPSGGSTLDKDEIVVNQLMETGRAGRLRRGRRDDLSGKARADRDAASARRRWR